jgi:hypothetical protein
MKNIALISGVVAAVTLLCGTTISNAQDRERLHAAVPQMEGARRGEGQTKGDGDRAHLRRPAVIVVTVPIFVGPAYGSYYQPPFIDVYRTLDGFYYYCMEAANYYPAVQDCPNGWRLVP